METGKTILSKDQALQKLRHYCAYQERCHSEVRKKLYSLGVRKGDHDEIISTLISDDYLNEERFAIQFAGGKFRMNHWGRIKIAQALKEKSLSDYCIRKALKQIDEDDYSQQLRQLAEKKYHSLKGQHLLRKKKTLDYLMQKGYEAAAGSAVIEQFAKSGRDA